MIIDKLGTFADDETIPTATGTAIVGDVVDLGANGMNFNDGAYLVVQITTAAASSGSATVNFTLASDAQAAIATDGTATVHGATGAIGKASLTAGKTFVIALPPGKYERYLGVLSTVGTAALTAGKASAFITMNPQNWVATTDGL